MAKKAKSSSYVSELNIPKIREGQKIKGTVLKKVSDSILVDCE